MNFIDFALLTCGILIISFLLGLFWASLNEEIWFNRR